jgi:FkbM family methyltransferase
MLYNSSRTVVLDTTAFTKTSFNEPLFLLPVPVFSIFKECAGGMPEKSLIDWTKKELLNRNKAFVDIGAHVGTYALSFAPHCSQVYAFECQATTYYHLCAGIALNGATNIQAHRVALSSSRGSSELRIISTDGGGSSICSLPTNSAPLGTERVKVKTLDSYKLRNVGLIKIDVEGNELKVLKGAIKTLKKNNYPKILFETWPDKWYETQKTELSNYLRELGYKVLPISGYSQMFLAEKSESIT